MRSRSSLRLLGAFVCSVAVCACSKKPVEEPSVEESSGGSSGESESSRDSLEISGLRGTLSQEEIRGALDPKLPKFARCLQRRAEDVEWLSGHMLLDFLVNVDGSVQRVFPRESSIGDRESESCALEVASQTRFPRPHGGEAEFTWSFELPLDDAIREPVAFTAADVSSAATELGPTISNDCGSGPFAVTAYLDTSGKVVSAGAAASDAESAQKLDCVVQAVQNITFPSPGSYAAKLTLQLP